MRWTTDRKGAEALVLPFWNDKKPAFTGKAPAGIPADFSGKAEEVLCLYPDSLKEKRLILVGLGDQKTLSKETLRRAYAGVVKFLQGKKAKAAAFQLPESKSLSRHDLVQGIIEGILLTNYAFDLYKSDPKTVLLENVALLGALTDDLKLCKKATQIAASVYFARDLVIGNADEVTPTLLGKKAVELAKEYSQIKTTVMNRSQIEKEGMGLLLAVSRASPTEPAFIISRYHGDPSSKQETVLIGKGITYDTGGLNLKPGPSMITMRDDMSGAALVLGTLRAAAELKLKVNLICLIASTENSIGSNSYKPGDVYRSHAGVTVEITDTDAEGRLVLADAISYAQTHFKPTRIIDFATLTGGAIVALGEEVAALCSNNDSLAEELFAAGESTYERLWRLPLYEEYKEVLKSKFADIKNAGARKASTISGAIFLQRFVKDVPWAHLDIAGVAFPEAQKPYHPVQATGFGIRLMVEYLERLKGKG